MKKVFLFFLASILIFLGLVYGLLFTPTGNSVVASYIQNSVNEKLTQANFEVEEFSLTTSKIKFIANIDSNSKVNISGDLALLDKSVDLNYEVNIKDLSKLQKFTNQKLNGSFFTKGSVKGDQKLVDIKGITDVFGSDTNYDAKLVNFKPTQVNLLVNKAKIEKLLYTLDQPIYAQGLLNVNAKIKNANLDTLDGIIATVITDGKVNNKIVNTAFNQKLKSLINFKGDIVTNLEPNKAISKIDFFTTPANVFVKEATVDLKTMKINSDYLVSIADLSKLYDFTQTKMRGAINLDGNIEKTAKDLKVDGKSNLLAGNLNFNLVNDDLKANIKGIDLRKLTHMMYYPDFFTSKANADVTFNTKSQKGNIDAKLLNGQFLANEFSTLINTFAKFDITKEVYEEIDLKSNIDKKVINSVINMKSKLTQIDVPKSKIDLNKSTIDAQIQTKLKGIEFNTVVSGDLNSPKVSVDTTQLLKLKIKKEGQKFIDKNKDKLKEKLREKLGAEAGGQTADDIINGFKAFFGNN
ncbi:hypothetical protein CRU98_08725 [Arcobacter sp. CECT 8986]|uniref:hypothetical protein n=1 Tax=Arcobacter sp. CECT 8986 TaxID=2044507 RepID=UPI0010099A17|nr:hypothetical protein [Arcobacter sp. CECT 8986]RXJ98838.1 hypothetical protein CRU98_08725 [Arcobacter sp. CECT 8986]